MASLLTILWANPSTCRTAKKSGLPIGRSVKCYGFAPPLAPCLSFFRLTLIVVYCFKPGVPWMRDFRLNGTNPISFLTGFEILTFFPGFHVVKNFITL